MSVSMVKLVPMVALVKAPVTMGGQRSAVAVERKSDKKTMRRDIMIVERSLDCEYIWVIPNQITRSTSPVFKLN